MKKLLIIFGFVIIAASCEKEDQDKSCPIISEESVPSAVTKTFKEKYENTKVDKWFKKDDIGYSALFTSNNQKTLSHFKNDGTFIKTQTVVDEDGEIENEDDDNGCECENEEEDDD